MSILFTEQIGDPITMGQLVEGRSFPYQNLFGDAGLKVNRRVVYDCVMGWQCELRDVSGELCEYVTAALIAVA